MWLQLVLFKKNLDKKSFLTNLTPSIHTVKVNEWKNWEPKERNTNPRPEGGQAVQNIDNFRYLINMAHD